MKLSNPSRSPRPLWLKLMALGFFTLSILGWLRLFESLARWDMLIAIGVQPGPLYTAISGFLTGSLALAASIGLWFHARWAPIYTRAFTILWLTWFWIDRAFISSSPNALANWPFLLGGSVIVLAGVFVLLQRGRDRF